MHECPKSAEFERRPKKNNITNKQTNEKRVFWLAAVWGGSDTGRVESWQSGPFADLTGVTSDANEHAVRRSWTVENE